MQEMKNVFGRRCRRLHFYKEKNSRMQLVTTSYTQSTAYFNVCSTSLTASVTDETERINDDAT